MFFGLPGALLFAATLPEEAADRPIVILYTSHGLYQRVAAGLAPAFERQGWAAVRYELGKGFIDTVPTDSASSGSDVEAQRAANANAPEGGASGEGSQDAGPKEAVLSSTHVKDLLAVRPSMLVTIGATATTVAAKSLPDLPIVFCMVPNGLDLLDSLRASTTAHRLAGITTNISPEDELAWVRRVTPRVDRIGVLHTARTERTVEVLAQAGRGIGLEVVPIKACKDAFPEAIDALNRKDCDAVLMIADAYVYNVANVQRLLLWGLRNRRAVWAFSEKLVKAGALAAVYGEHGRVDDQLVKLIKRIRNGAKLQRIGIEYAADACTAVNERTAEMIGVRVGAQQLEQMTQRYGKD